MSSLNFGNIIDGYEEHAQQLLQCLKKFKIKKLVIGDTVVKSIQGIANDVTYITADSQPDFFDCLGPPYNSRVWDFLSKQQAEKLEIK